MSNAQTMADCAGAHRLKLVKCAPYNARLTVAGCVKRYRRALGMANTTARTAAQERALLLKESPTALCRDCSTGKRRAKSCAAVATIQYRGAFGR